MLEILAPAGNAECAFAAINNGADAVYLGFSAFSARQSAENFDESAFRAIVQKARFCGVKVYVAMNTVVKDGELEEFFKTLLLVWNWGADAVILQDAFLGRFIHRNYPEIVLHLSTQAGVCNLESARFAKECGFSRVILARETPLAEIQKIAQEIETEVFVQGALCTAYSGQCYFSSFAGGNSGNRGRCKQPCRKLYAYDRNGNTEKTYALSLSDLCVGEDIQKLIDAGVVSFKIEGRMRRAEYVAAAVRYYRILLDGRSGAENALSDLKRAYNRGNYTKGLAFGQDKRFLSPAVQGHLGEKVGVVKVFNGKYLVESAFAPRQGDAFKILRAGKEIGGATYLKREGKHFVITSKIRLLSGDSVFITTDTAVNERVLQAEKTGKITVSLFFHEGETPVIECEDIRFAGEQPLQSAKSRPLTVEELKTCFLKTDGLPVRVEFDKIDIQGDIFIPKSELNGLRRKVYSMLVQEKTGERKTEYRPIEIPKPTGINGKTAVIAEDFTGINTEIAIYKPNDYTLPVPYSLQAGKFEKYLYYPAFATSADLQAIKARLSETAFDGIYAENYGGLIFAKDNGFKVFAGTGFNLINSLSVAELMKDTSVAYYAISNEANADEAEMLVGDKAFALSYGGIKLMDLCYCPFGKTCKACDKKRVYSLTDENGRVFPVRRYLSADGSCRFEVYNCADLIGKGINSAGQLLDFTLIAEKTVAFLAKDDEQSQKEICKNYTSGHYKRGVL